MTSTANTIGIKDPNKIILDSFNKANEYARVFIDSPSMQGLNELRVLHGKARISLHQILNNASPEDDETCIKVSTFSHIVTMMENIIDKCDKQFESQPSALSERNGRTGTTEINPILATVPNPEILESLKNTEFPPRRTIFTDRYNTIPVSKQDDYPQRSFGDIVSVQPPMNSEIDRTYSGLMKEMKSNPESIFVLSNNFPSQGTTQMPTQALGGKETEIPWYRNIKTPRLTETTMGLAPLDISKPTLLLVHGKTWCGGSKQYYAKTWIPLKQKLADRDVNLLELSVKNNTKAQDPAVTEITKALGITSVPVLFLFYQHKITTINSRDVDGIISEANLQNV